MTESQREQVDDLFGDLLEQDPSTWRAALAAVDDPEVRAKVQLLLRHSAPTAKGLDTSIAEVMRAATVSGAFDDRTIGPGTRFERYRIQRKIGQGGMGDVYEAVRENDFHKRVALKIVRYGLDSDYARGRFQQERQTLAGLEHPFIARLLDGGEAENGCPYLVLEFVDGVPIDTFCEGRSQREILQLFLKACEAVEYAHRNLVIHRDLKPANILVTADGDPKLLDFGIAKLLDPSANVTQTMAVALTPQYASPEQIRNQPITTASDVYSLGVILYQLLTGRKPYQVETTTALEMERVICLEPPAPAHLGNEIDDILMMALRKEPERRYAGVAQFAQDIQRFLAGDTVSAAPDTFRYRAGKFLRRHKIGIAAVAAVIITLVTGLASTLYQKRRAELEMQRSERRFQDVRSLANTFLFEFHDKISALPGSTEAREMVVTTALKYLDKLSLEAGNDRSLLYELQAAYLRTGDVLGDPTSPSLGHPDKAMATYRRSIEIGENLRSTGKPTLDSLEALGTAYYRVGMVNLAGEKPREAMAPFQKALEITGEEEKAGKNPYILLTRVYTGIAYSHRLTGDAQDALKSSQLALAAEQSYASQKPSNNTRMAVSKIRNQVADDMVNVGDLNGAVQQYRLAIDDLGALMNVATLKSGERIRRAYALINVSAGGALGDPLQPNLGDRAASLACLEKARDVEEAMFASDPKDATIKTTLAELYETMAFVIGESDPHRATDLFHKSIANIDDYEAAGPRDQRTKFIRALALYGLGHLQVQQHHTSAALPVLRQALTVQRGLPADDNTATEPRQLIAQILIDMGDPASLDEALKIADDLWKTHPQSLSDIQTLANVYEALGDAARRFHDTAAARAWYIKSRDLWKNWPQHGVSSPFDVERARKAEQLAAQFASPSSPL